MKPQEVQEKNQPPSSSESREYMQAWRSLSSWAYTGCHVCAVSPVSPKLPTSVHMQVYGYVLRLLNAWQPGCSPCTVALIMLLFIRISQTNKTVFWVSTRQYFQSEKRECVAALYLRLSHNTRFSWFWEVMVGPSFMFHYFRKIQRCF